MSVKKKKNFEEKEIIKIYFRMDYFPKPGEEYSIEKNVDGKIHLVVDRSDLKVIDSFVFKYYCFYLKNKLKIFNLKSEYINENVLDGYGWELEIIFDDWAIFKSSGLNKKPRKVSKLIKILDYLRLNPFDLIDMEI